MDLLFLKKFCWHYLVWYHLLLWWQARTESSVLLPYSRASLWQLKCEIKIEQKDYYMLSIVCKNTYYCSFMLSTRSWMLNNPTRCGPCCRCDGKTEVESEQGRRNVMNHWRKGMVVVVDNNKNTFLPSQIILIYPYLSSDMDLKKKKLFPYESTWLADHYCNFSRSIISRKLN